MSVELKRRSGFAATLGAFLLLLAAPAQAADNDTLPMHFSVAATTANCGDCVIINASGQIGDDTARDFANFISQNRLNGVLPIEQPDGQAATANKIKVIVAFESIGGKVQPALIMGRRIRKSGWITVVGRARLESGRPVFAGTGCYSACTMVMLGGSNRFVIPGSRIGIHQFSPQFNDGETFDAEEMNQIVRDYGREVVSVYDFVRTMGVDESFFLATLRTPFNSLDVLPEKQWVSTGVATSSLPATDGETPVENILAALGRIDVLNSAHEPPPAAPAQTQAAATAFSSGSWTVAHAAGEQASVQFSGNDLRISLACSENKQARLNLSFRDLSPLDLERMRAAAFSARLLKIAGVQVAIDNIALPVNGEQSIGALVDIDEVKAMPKGDALTFAVVDKAGTPVGRASTVPTAGAAKAIVAAMAACGG